MKITPKFDVRQIMADTIRKDWFNFQNLAFESGLSIAKYMQDYINSRHRRRGASGNLANAITFESLSTAPARIGWGVGNISVLNAKAKYWYVVNYGKMVTGQAFIPGKGKFIPGSFEGDAPRSALKGGVQKFNYQDGSNMGMFPKNPIRPMNYIQASRRKFNKDLNLLLLQMRKGL